MPEFRWVDVRSSNLHQIAYDEPSRTLAIRFLGGGEYHYRDVHRGVWVGLHAAASHGKYFHKFVRDKFAFEKVA